MSPLAEFDQRMEQIIRDFALRIIVPRSTEFDSLFEAAIRVCDRYKLGTPEQERNLPKSSDYRFVSPEGRR